MRGHCGAKASTITGSRLGKHYTHRIRSFLRRAHRDDDHRDVIVGLASVALGLDRLYHGVARAAWLAWGTGLGVGLGLGLGLGLG